MIQDHALILGGWVNEFYKLPSKWADDEVIYSIELKDSTLTIQGFRVLKDKTDFNLYDFLSTMQVRPFHHIFHYSKLAGIELLKPIFNFEEQYQENIGFDLFLNVHLRISHNKLTKLHDTINRNYTAPRTDNTMLSDNEHRVTLN